MTQRLYPIASLVTSGSWGLVGAPTRHEAIDEGTAPSDGNASYIQGTTDLGVIDLTMLNPIEPGGLRTGFSIVMQSRRVGAQFDPAKEPDIALTVFKDADTTPIASQTFKHTGGNVFTDYTLPLTSLQATTLWPGPIRIRMAVTFIVAGNTIRVTALDFLLPDPEIIIIPATLSFSFRSTSIAIDTGGAGTDRAWIESSGAEAGAIAMAGAEAGWVSQCP